MSKKHLVLSTVLYVLLFFGLTGEVLGDASEQFEQAGTHEKNKEYDQAEEIYQQILASSADPNDGLKAQTQLTRLYIAADRQPEADAALQELLADFSRHPDIAQAVREIANHYRGLEKYTKAKQLYQHVLDNWLEHEQAMWAQAGLAILSISLGNDSAAEAAVDKLVSDFSGYKNIVAGIRQAAYYYDRIGKYENAIELHQYVLDNWPKTKQAIQSLKQVVLLSVELEDEAGANSATEKLLTEFSADDRIPRVVADIANKYQILQRHAEAGQLYQYIVDNWPESETALRAQAEVAISNIALGNDAAAETAFNKLISDFSDDPRLPEALTPDSHIRFYILAQLSRHIRTGPLF